MYASMEFWENMIQEFKKRQALKHTIQYMILGAVFVLLAFGLMIWNTYNLPNNVALQMSNFGLMVLGLTFFALLFVTGLTLDFVDLAKDHDRAKRHTSGSRDQAHD